MRIFWNGCDQLMNARRKARLFAELLFELSQFFAVRQSPVPQEVDDLFKGCVVGKIVNIVPAVDKPAFQPIYIADSRLCGYYPLQTGPGYIGFTRHLRSIPFPGVSLID